MSKVVLLDAGPLGLLSQARASVATETCNAWLQSLVAQDVRVAVAEIADYEVRRELIRIGSIRGLARLDGLNARLLYLPITTEIMLKAAEYWALVRRRGRPTAANAALDGDVILAASAFVLAQAGDEPVIATTNVRHLGLLSDARPWPEIT